MNTASLLAHALDLAQRLGYQVRQEWLDGNGGGFCELKGRKVLFVDLAQGPAEQFELVLDAMRHEPEAIDLPMPHPLRELLTVRKSA
ncbi:MAG: hypothetical protein ABSF26_06595 [Thermoguttaceae bacterium]|jgi:hypothetical protein